MFRVLSIDGGGIRGVIPAKILEHIEAETKKPISESFDLIIGTSTGGILAAGVAVKRTKSSKQPKFSATQLVALYENHGNEIFDRSFWKGLTSAKGVFDEKYDAANLEKLLNEYFGKMTLLDVLKPIALTSYDIETRSPYFFKTVRARERASRNHLLKDACRATSAAPTFFEPALVPTASGRGIKRALVDGGVFMNNPSSAGLVEAMAMGAKLEDIMLVSLGTGENTRSIPYEDAKDWGIAGWISPLISVMMDGQADSSHFQCKQILPGKGDNANQRYFRFDTLLDIALDDMDAAHSANIEALKREADQILETEADEIARMIDSLKD